MKIKKEEGNEGIERKRKEKEEWREKGNQERIRNKSKKEKM